MSDTKQQLESSKSELEVTKTDLESRVATLQTKDGADAFIAERKAQVDAYLGRNPSMTPKDPTRMTMGRFMSIQKKMLDDNPTAVVTREIVETEKRLVKVDADIKKIDDSLIKEGR